MAHNVYGTLSSMPYLRLEEQTTSVAHSINLNPSPQRVGQAALLPGQGGVQTPLYTGHSAPPSRVRLAPGDVLITPGETHKSAQNAHYASLRDRTRSREGKIRIVAAVFVFLLGLSLIFGVGLLAVKLKNRNKLRASTAAAVAAVVPGDAPSTKPKPVPLPAAMIKLKDKARAKRQQLKARKALNADKKRVYNLTAAEAAAATLGTPAELVF